MIGHFTVVFLLFCFFLSFFLREGNKVTPINSVSPPPSLLRLSIDSIAHITGWMRRERDRRKGGLKGVVSKGAQTSRVRRERRGNRQPPTAKQINDEDAPNVDALSPFGRKEPGVLLGGRSS